MKRILFGAAALLSLGTSCNPAEGVCSKEFECQAELGLSLDDDYVAVCAATLEGQNNALRKNAEPQCEDLANAGVTLAICESALGCDDLKKAREDPTGAGDLCSDPRKGVVDAFAAADSGLDCDGVENPVAGEGEGEGEGE